MSREAYNPPEPSAWFTRYLRLIAFPVEPQVKAQRDWWKDLTGEEPEEATRRKEQIEEAGPLGANRLLTVSVDLFRINWTLIAVTTAEKFVDEFPTLGEFGKAKGEFTELMRRWLKQAPLIKRLAFNTGLFLKAATHEDAYRILDRLLPTLEVDPGSSDFQYRINRKRLSTVEPSGVLINRLSNWGAVRLETKVGIGPDLMDENTRSVNEEFHASLELDVNTDQKRKEALTAEKLGDLYSELGELAFEIAKAGDVKG